MSRVLLVSPDFHGYWRSLQGALERAGHQVSVYRYDRFATVAAKVRNKVRYELPDRLGRSDGAQRRSRRLTEAAIQVLREASPEVVVTVRGDALEAPFWDEVDRLAARRVVWSYDELRRTTWTPERLRAIGPVASYSPQDTADLTSAGLDATHLPLAFDPYALTPGFAPGTTATSVRDIVFVGARYPQRETVLQSLVDVGTPVRAYGRDWSGHPFDRLRTWRVRGSAVPGGRDLDRSRAYEVMARATAALNIHGDQDGFTMRTFEICGAGGLQLVDRTDVCHLYAPGEQVACWSSLDELHELVHRAQRDTAWAQQLREAGRRRTLAEHTFDERVKVLQQLWERSGD